MKERKKMRRREEDIWQKGEEREGVENGGQVGEER